jgi:hypothetical protein
VILKANMGWAPQQQTQNKQNQCKKILTIVRK